jgi:hypothetical protein
MYNKPIQLRLEKEKSKMNHLITETENLDIKVATKAVITKFVTELSITYYASPKRRVGLRSRQ